MILSRCKDQKSKSLDEFYESISKGPDEASRRMGEAMLHLIARLRQNPDNRTVFGLTSHYHLSLLAADDYTTPSYVTVIAQDRRNYHIDFAMPEAMAPWPNARIQGTARSEDQAVEWILIAMTASEGWA